MREAKENYRFPPGLQRNLLLHTFNRFLKLGDPIRLFEYLEKSYGSIAHYKLAHNHIVYTSDPAFVQEILVNQAGSFVKERTLRRMKILLGEGLITSDDPIHKRQRRIAAPAFHRQRIAAYADSIVAIAAAHRDRLQPGDIFDANAGMMQLSLEITARTLFDIEVTADVLAINDEVNRIMGLYNFLVLLPRLESYLHLPLPGIMRFRKSRKKLNAVVHRMIAEHRAANIDRGDLLSMLISSQDQELNADGTDKGAPQSMTDEQIRDEVLTIFLAGYETVANALTWTWYLLSQNPEAAAKMHAELDTVLGTGASARLPRLDDFASLRYTEMVFAESMRLYPPAWAMGRQNSVPVSLGPYRFPPNTHFFFSQYMIQRKPEFFPDPLRFDPERHTPEQKSTRPRFAYFPFGGGGRQCIGESFAWMEGILVLATIAQKWRFEFVPQYPVIPQPKITLRPKYPIMMTVLPR
jgi:cytochrome P450